MKSFAILKLYQFQNDFYGEESNEKNDLYVYDFFHSIIRLGATGKKNRNDRPRLYGRLRETRRQGGQKRKPEYIEKILTEIPNFALDEQKEKWIEISREALKTKDYEQSCKSCHKEFKKEYKKTYRKRPIQVSQELVTYLKALKK